MLKNPDDPHTEKVFDPSIRGKTDKFLLKFKKPGGLPSRERSQIIRLGLLLLLLLPSTAGVESGKEFVSVFGAALRQIGHYYLEPVTPENLAVAGLGGLAALDKDLSFQAQDHVAHLVRTR